jgi:hypothetical protein
LICSPDPDLDPTVLVIFGPVALIKRKSKFPHIQYKEIQNGAVAKSYMTNGLICDFATAPL